MAVASRARILGGIGREFMEKQGGSVNERREPNIGPLM